jgi:hypothetical protein
MKMNERAKHHIDGFNKSGLTKAEYCRLNDLKSSTFHTWYSKNKLGLKHANLKQTKIDWKTLELEETESKNFFELKICNFKIEINLRFSF